MGRVADRNMHLWRYQLPADLPSVQADARLLQMALQQLVDNAIKYAPCGY